MKGAISGNTGKLTLVLASRAESPVVDVPSYALIKFGLVSAIGASAYSGLSPFLRHAAENPQSGGIKLLQAKFQSPTWSGRTAGSPGADLGKVV